MYIHVSIYVYMYIMVCVKNEYIYIYICIYMYLYIYIHVYYGVYIYTYVCMYTHVSVYINMYTYIYIYIYIYIYGRETLCAPWRSMLRIQDSRFWEKLLGPRSFWAQGSRFWGRLLGSRPQALTREVWEEDLDPRSFPSESWILNPEEASLEGSWIQKVSIRSLNLERLNTKNIIIEILHACLLLTILYSKSKTEWFVSKLYQVQK